MQTSSSDRIRRVLIAVTGLPLTLLAVRGLFVRWVGDDYWTLAAVKTHGFLGAQAWWYRVWSGRFAFTFLMTAIESVGSGLTGLLVPLVIVAAIVVLTRLINLPMAFALTYAILFGTVNLQQSMLWETGLVTYVVPFFLPVIGAGFSEIYAIAQVIAFTVWRKWWALAGTIVVLGIVAAAPGNAVRNALYPPALPIGALIARTIASTFVFFVDTVSRCGAALVLVFTAALLLAPRVSKRVAVLAAITAVAVAIATYGVTLFLITLAPPSRALIVPHAFFVAAIAAAGASIPLPDRWRKAAAIVLVAACAGGPVVDAVRMARSIPSAHRFARAWDTLDSQLRRLPDKHVIIDRAPGMVGDIIFITHDPENFMNRATARYYGLRSVAAVPVSAGGVELLKNLFVNPPERPGGHDQHDVVRLRFASDSRGN